MISFRTVSNSALNADFNRQILNGRPRLLKKEPQNKEPRKRGFPPSRVRAFFDVLGFGHGSAAL